MVKRKAPFRPRKVPFRPRKAPLRPRKVAGRAATVARKAARKMTARRDGRRAGRAGRAGRADRVTAPKRQRTSTPNNNIINLVSSSSNSQRSEGVQVSNNVNNRRRGKRPKVAANNDNVANLLSSNSNGAGPSRPSRPSRPNARNARLNSPAELPLVRRSPLANRAAANNASNSWIQRRFGPFTLQPHQVAAVKLFCKPGVPGLLLYYKVGSGKTLASIAAAENLARRERVPRRVVVVVPASLRENYRKELRLAGVDASRYTVLSFEGVHGMSTRQRQELGQDAVVVVDEVQNLRNPESKRLDSMLHLAWFAHKRLLLSGTPVMNYPMDIGTTLGLLDPPNNSMRTIKRPLGDSRWAYTFAKRYGRTVTKRAEELWAMLRCTSLFYQPDDETVRREYPTKREVWVEVPLHRQQVAMQLRMAEEQPSLVVEELLEGSLEGSHSPAFLTRPREVNTRLNNIHPKIDEVVRRVEQEHRRGGKCVVFSSYLRNALYRIEELLQQREVAVVVFEGAASQADKARMIRQYNSGGVRVLLISDAGKEGLDLKETTQVHVVEPQWNEDKVAQVIGRAVRYRSHSGPNRHVDVFRYCAVFPPGIDDLLEQVDRSAEDGNVSLFSYSADDILRIITGWKQDANTRFLQKLVEVSDDNLRSCI